MPPLRQESDQTRPYRGKISKPRVHPVRHIRTNTPTLDAANGVRPVGSQSEARLPGGMPPKPPQHGADDGRPVPAALHDHAPNPRAGLVQQPKWSGRLPLAGTPPQVMGTIQAHHSLRPSTQAKHARLGIFVTAAPAGSQPSHPDLRSDLRALTTRGHTKIGTASGLGFGMADPPGTLLGMEQPIGPWPAARSSADAVADHE